MPSGIDAATTFSQRVQADLTALLGEGVTADLAAAAIEAIGIAAGDEQPAPSEPFSADEVVLISYGDSISGFSTALAGLEWLVTEQVPNVFSTVHVLPFYPSSGDGGFSVKDYYAVAEHLGTWDDLAQVAGTSSGTGDGRMLMADLIVNHGSAQSAWFEQFLADEEPGRGFWKLADPDTDLSDVVRPRTHPLLRQVETSAGPRHVWCTFSHDQVDFDFANPEVVLEFLRITDHLLRNGVRRLRLDAIAYLWKEVGTDCIHLPQTHAFVRLVRTLLDVRQPDVLIITETNVPHKENVSYFGSGDEAHVVYNFSLVPLVLHSVLTGDTTALSHWAHSLGAPRYGTTYLNFLASHDGLGVRPAEGLLDDAERAALVHAAIEAGGTWSPYATPDGERPYELNVALADLLGGPDFSSPGRYVAAHAIMLAFIGIPAVYVHSLLMSAGDVALADETGVRRDINRGTVRADDVRALVEGRNGNRSHAFAELVRLIATRRAQRAFSPLASQHMLDLQDGVVAILRGASAGDPAASSEGASEVLALTNVTDVPVTVDFHGRWHAWADLLDEGFVVDAALDGVVLGAWQTRWLVAADD